VARVVIKDVDLDFPIYGTQHLSLRHAIYRRATGGVIEHSSAGGDRVVVRALQGISMELKEGDRLGLVGHNGAGKSTLLKAIAGIYEPIRGSILIDGTVTPLFDMMPGLDVEDTGYENIFTSGLLLGMSRQFIESKIPEIEEFCELGEYLSLPVRTYSTGMMTRLGFALVTALDPDVLLMDEGFGAADLRFAERSAERMEKFIGRSRIMILASHSDSMIASICNKAAWLNGGQLVEVGPVDEIFEKYHESVHRERSSKIKSTPAEGAMLLEEESQAAPQLLRPIYSEGSIRDVGIEDRLSRTTGELIFTRLVARDPDGCTRWNYRHGDTVVFHLEYEAVRPVPDLILLLRLLAGDESTGAEMQVVSSVCDVVSVERIGAGQQGTIDITIRNLPFLSGKLFVYGWLGRCDRSRSYDVVDQNVALPQLEVELDCAPSFGASLIPLDFSITKSEPQQLNSAPAAARSEMS
jgi:ABC-type polysaccharide/polyol phosphate transport system ATPase subunit